MLRKIIFSVLLCFGIQCLFAQDFTNLWEGHFSYLNIKAVTKGNDKIYVAAENAIFIYDEFTQEIETKSTVHGLSGETISTIHYSETYELLLVGYRTGLIKVYIEGEDDMLTVVDILEKQNIAPDQKKINHFNEFENVVYIATDYGISVFDLERFEFGDTYFMGIGGAQVMVNQTEVFGDYIYAACSNNNGIRRALVAVDDLIDFQVWNQEFSGNYTGIQKVGDRLYTLRTNKTIYEIQNNLINLVSFDTLPVDFENYNDGRLVVTRNNAVYIYDSNFTLIHQVNDFPEFSPSYSCAISSGDTIYLGTSNDGFVKTTILTPTEYESIYSEGPLINNAFSIQAGFNRLWVSYGDYTRSFNPGAKYLGVSVLQNDMWRLISHDSISEAVGQNVANLNAISFNPLNPSQVFVSSFQHGILVIDNDEIVLWNDQNSGLESLFVPSFPNFKSIRVAGTNFDNQGVLWSITSRVDSPLKSYDQTTGQWQSYSFTELIPVGLNDELGFKDLEITSDGTKWVSSVRNGLIGYNVETGSINNVKDELLHNMPDPYVTAIAADDRNQIWIGTVRGLRVLYNTAGFFDDATVSTQAIIILEDGIPSELLAEQYITDIKVDGSNNKWVGTLGAGLFYFTSDGQETIYHFTTENSPLPSNEINEMSIDDTTGKVFIATNRGLVSFLSGASKPQETLEEAYVYPNPVRPDFNMFDKKIKIKDISENCNIKITDIEGNLVAEAQSNTNLRFRGYNLEIDGGTAFWNGRNLANNSVATGVYLVMLTDLDTQETNVLKLMIVR